MQIILLERVGNLGSLGEEVSVRDGFARNYLLPKGKALVANAKNRARFEAQRASIEARNNEAMAQARTLGEKLDGICLTLIRRASATGQLYGSVSMRDIVQAASDAGHEIRRDQIDLNAPIKTLGLHDVAIRLHAEVQIGVRVNIARSADEAERQATSLSVDDTDSANGTESASDTDAEPTAGQTDGEPVASDGEKPDAAEAAEAAETAAPS